MMRDFLGITGFMLIGILTLMVGIAAAPLIIAFNFSPIIIIIWSIALAVKFVIG